MKNKSLKRVNFKILNFQSSFTIAKACDIDNFIVVKGKIVKIEPIKQLIESIEFDCIKCHSSFRKLMHHGIILFPKKCANSNCMSLNFKIKN